MTDWIEWKGGECPVADGTRVCIRFRHGNSYSNVRAGRYDWRHHGEAVVDGDTDIIAYRVVQS